MTRKLLLLALPLLLSGCADFALPSSKTYTPIWAELNNQAQYNADLAECHWASDNLSSTPDAGTVASQTMQGGMNNGAVADINPLTIAGGAAGGLIGGVVGGFDLTGQNSIRVLVLCMDKLTAKDGSAIMADFHE